MGLFEKKNITVQTEKAAKAQAKGEIKAAKLQAKSNEKIAKMNKSQVDNVAESAKIQAKSNEKIAKMRIKAKEKQQAKLNQEGIYKKIGPFTIKFYLIAAAIIFFLIFALVTNAKNNVEENHSQEPVQNSIEITE